MPRTRKSETWGRAVDVIRSGGRGCSGPEGPVQQRQRPLLGLDERKVVIFYILLFWGKGIIVTMVFIEGFGYAKIQSTTYLAYTDFAYRLRLLTRVYRLEVSLGGGIMHKCDGSYRRVDCVASHWPFILCRQVPARQLASNTVLIVHDWNSTSTESAPRHYYCKFGHGDWLHLQILSFKKLRLQNREFIKAAMPASFMPPARGGTA